MQALYFSLFSLSLFQMTIRQSRYLVIVSWFLGFVASFWYALSLKLETDKNGRLHCAQLSDRTWVTTALLVLLIGTQWLPGAAFTVAYIRIIIKLRRDAVISPADVSQSSQNRHRRNLRAARILVIEVLFFLGCLFPFYQHTIATATENSAAAGSLTPQGMLVYCMMMTYSLTNPFCHILLNSEFREEVKKISRQLKAFCGLENKGISDFHLPGWHVHHEETRQNEGSNIHNQGR